jgi:hypothetical protein
LAEGERPPHGVAGLVDWRLAGRLSELIRTGFARGEVGEVLLLPGRPKLSFEKVVIFGIGRGANFNEQIYRGIVERLLGTLEGLKVRSAVVELPGRHLDCIAPERAVEVLFSYAGGRHEHDLWTLVEPPAAQRAIARVLRKDRQHRLRDEELALISEPRRKGL